MSNTYNVGPDAGMYPTIQDAIADINLRVPAPSVEDRAVVLVWPGPTYDSTAFGTIDVPTHVSIAGVAVTHDAIRVKNDTAPVFRCTGPVTGFSNLSIIAAAAPDVYAIEGNNQSRIRIDNVNLLGNTSQRGRFFRQSGSSWVNVAIRGGFVNSFCNGNGALPNEQGVVLFENSGPATRALDVWLQYVFWDCHGWTGGVNGNVLALFGCEDTRVSFSEIRALGGNGRAILATGAGAATGPTKVRINHVYAEGSSAGIFVSTTGGTSQAFLYNTEARGRFGNGATAPQYFNSRT